LISKVKKIKIIWIVTQNLRGCGEYGNSVYECLYGEVCVNVVT
jgi:hypothetical protein